jgi:hypothetical protein
MKGKSGKLIMIIKAGESITLDGPGTFLIKQIRKHKVLIMIDADDETNIKKGSKEMAEIKQMAKE